MPKHGMTIGELARRANLSASALRYYEKAKLLPKPDRVGGQRRYGKEILGRIHVVKLALAAGFTVGETRTFLADASAGARPAARWRALAVRKMDEMDAHIARAQQMKKLLATSFRCGCVQLSDCERLVARASERM